ncbi:MAG TPA: DUF4238 domain-containing protein [Polyangiaceae bacterium]|nr:DUF4238 domain-containing protein [Polyangiaceae bacterium]
MVDRKHQHFVPRFLLKHFATPGTRERAISAIDLDDGKCRDSISIAGQCGRSFFYGRDGLMEGLLGELEGAAAKAMRALIELGPERPPFKPEDAVTLLVFIAAQHGRTPAAVAEQEAQYRGLIERGLANRIADPEERARGAEYLISRDINAFGSTQTSVAIGSSLADLADLLVVNDSNVQFVTSDIGVVLHNQWAQPVRGVGVLGFACSGLQVFLPLSPRHLLVKYDAAIYAPPRSTIHIRATESVHTVNRFQCAYAERHLYFTGDPDTRASLVELQRTTPRAYRSKNVHVERLKQVDGHEELIVWHSDQARLNARLAWLPIRRSMASVPVQQRGQAWRPKAMEAIRSNPRLTEPPPPPAHLMGKSFKFDPT